jgi:hypothetical protein
VTHTHGEERARIPLAQQIAECFGIGAELPPRNDVVTVGGTDG